MIYLAEKEMEKLSPFKVVHGNLVHLIIGWFRHKKTIQVENIQNQLLFS